MSTKINSFSQTYLGNAINAVQDAKANKAEAAFQTFLNHAVSDGTSQKQTDVVASLSAKTDKTECSYSESSETTDRVRDTKTEATYEKERPVSESVDETDTEKADRLMEEIADEMGISKEELVENYEELLNSIASILMEKFQVTEDELKTVLENMGLTLTDLFQQQNFMDVAMALSGVEDTAAILTDENLYATIQEAFGELTGLKESMESEGTWKPEQLELVGKSMEIMNQESDESLVVKETADMDVMAEKTVQEPVMEIVTDKKEGTAGHDNQGSMTGNEAFQHFNGRVAEQVQQIVTDNGSAYASQADMEAIIRQVTDYVKMQVHADTTSLEMQLHPDSYGKLNLHVAVREGVVTAKIAVENEVVKQALETQMVQLREDMSERGLKVDSVEVTIASHEFERNLEDGQEQSEASRQEAETSRRGINLREEGMSLEDIAAMSEAEALTRKIMLENGNSIDFSA